MRTRARGLATVQRRHAITENENTKQSTKRCQDLFSVHCDVRIQDFTAASRDPDLQKTDLDSVLYSVFCSRFL